MQTLPVTHIIEAIKHLPLRDLEQVRNTITAQEMYFRGFRKDKNQGDRMPARIFVADTLVHGRDISELEQAVKEGLVIRDYLNAEISMGEFAELMGMEYVEARDWLHSQGISTTKKLPRTLKHIAEKNQEKLAQELGI